MSGIVIGYSLCFVVLVSLVLLFAEVLNNCTRNRNDELLDLLAKKGSFVELWRVCEKIGLVCTVDYEDGTRSEIYLNCFRGRIGRTVSWDTLAITVGSFLVNGKFATEKEMTELASRLGKYYKEEWGFLIERFATKAGERYKGTQNENTVVQGLKDAFLRAKSIILEKRQEESAGREELKRRMRIQKILRKNYRIH